MTVAWTGSEPGPAMTSAVRVTSRLGGIELADWRGRPVRLGSLWSDRPVVLAFVRHFG